MRGLAAAEPPNHDKVEAVLGETHEEIMQPLLPLSALALGKSGGFSENIGNLEFMPLIVTQVHLSHPSSLAGMDDDQLVVSKRPTGRLKSRRLQLQAKQGKLLGFAIGRLLRIRAP